MSKDYDDFLYHNICPWCDENYKTVNHSLGCPNPKSQLSDRGKKIINTLGILGVLTEHEIQCLKA